MHQFWILPFFVFKMTTIILVCSISHGFVYQIENVDWFVSESRTKVARIYPAINLVLSDSYYLFFQNDLKKIGIYTVVVVIHVRMIFIAKRMWLVKFWKGVFVALPAHPCLCPKKGNGTRIIVKQNAKFLPWDSCGRRWDSCASGRDS